MENMQSVTTEDLIATCANYRDTPDAVLAATELKRRTGDNQWSAEVFARNPFVKPETRRARFPADEAANA